MPDPKLIFEAIAAAGGLAAAILLVCGWPWRAPNPKCVAAGWALGVGIGFFVGCWVLGLVSFRWPPAEGVDRLLLMLLPGVVVAELVAAIVPHPHWLAWLLRSIVVAMAGRILLNNTSYIADLPGATREWSVAQAWTYLAGMAAALALAWTLLIWLASRAPSRSIPLSLAVTCAVAAVTIMLSGYATGGQLGFPLSAALVGAVAASLALPKLMQLHAGLGVGIVGLFAMLVLGRFFGQLTTTHAVILFVAPLLGWLTELSFLRRVKSWQRGLIQLLLVAVPLIVVVIQAQRQFAADSQNDTSATDPYSGYK